MRSCYCVDSILVCIMTYFVSIIVTLALLVVGGTCTSKPPDHDARAYCKLIDSHIPHRISTEVSKFMRLVTKKIAGCNDTPKFAIRGGGHTIWSGAANNNHGITMDLRAMNEVILNDDRTVATLGAGGIWSDIYPQLVPHKVTVMGGRVSGIGVGGLATGGKFDIPAHLSLYSHFLFFLRFQLLDSNNA